MLFNLVLYVWTDGQTIEHLTKVIHSEMQINQIRSHVHLTVVVFFFAHYYLQSIFLRPAL